MIHYILSKENLTYINQKVYLLYTRLPNKWSKSEAIKMLSYISFAKMVSMYVIVLVILHFRSILFCHFGIHSTKYVVWLLFWEWYQYLLIILVCPLLIVLGPDVDADTLHDSWWLLDPPPWLVNVVSEVSCKKPCIKIKYFSTVGF